MPAVADGLLPQSPAYVLVLHDLHFDTDTPDSLGRNLEQRSDGHQQDSWVDTRPGHSLTY